MLRKSGSQARPSTPCFAASPHWQIAPPEIKCAISRTGARAGFPASLEATEADRRGAGAGLVIGTGQDNEAVEQAVRSGAGSSRQASGGRGEQQWPEGGLFSNERPVVVLTMFLPRAGWATGTALRSPSPRKPAACSAPRQTGTAGSCPGPPGPWYRPGADWAPPRGSATPVRGKQAASVAEGAEAAAGLLERARSHPRLPRGLRSRSRTRWRLMG